MPRVYSDRIMLREYKKEDFPSIRKWVNDPEVVQYLSDIFLFPHTENMTEAFLNSVLMGNEKDSAHFIIADKTTAEYLGQVDLISIDWKNRVAEIGIVIGAEENRGRGVGTEALKLLQTFVFESLNLNRLEIKVRDFNDRAIRCYLKSGFLEEGRFRKNFFVQGEYHDTICLAMLRSEYEEACQ